MKLALLTTLGLALLCGGCASTGEVDVVTGYWTYPPYFEGYYYPGYPPPVVIIRERHHRHRMPPNCVVNPKPHIAPKHNKQMPQKSTVQRPPSNRSIPQKSTLNSKTQRGI